MIGGTTVALHVSSYIETGCEFLSRLSLFFPVVTRVTWSMFCLFYCLLVLYVSEMFGPVWIRMKVFEYYPGMMLVYHSTIDSALLVICPPL